MPSVFEAEPLTIAQAAEIIGQASREGQRVSIERAGGELVVSTRYLNRLLEHEAGDLTVTVEAGIRLSALNERLAEHGQMLALDPPGDPTIGAAIAGDLFGPRAYRYGRARDLLLGVTIVLADGTVANAGGKVVKNVAGYDLAKLLCGSRGRLGLIARASLRLHPRPEASRTLVVPVAAPDDAQALVRTLIHSHAHPERRRSRLERGAIHPRPPFRGRRGGDVGPARAGRVRFSAETRTAPSGTRWRRASSAPAHGVRSRRASSPPRWRSCPRRSFGSGPRASRTCPSPTSSSGPRSPNECGRSSTPTGSSRDGNRPRAHQHLRPLRLLPADVPDLGSLAGGDGLAARAHLPDGRRSPTGRSASTRRSSSTSIAASAAWLASPSCPSGVLYDRLIEQTRATIEREYRRPRRERALRSAVLAVVPHPRRLRKALRLAPAGRRLPLPALLRPLTDLAPPWRSRAAPPELTEPVGEQAAGRVGLLTGCVQRVLFGDVNVATARVLAAYGFEVVAPRGQGCCGALAVHAGRRGPGP